MLNVESLTKRYGDRTAVDDLSFTVTPGTVTGFLGPNGAGKSTTMRVLVGLDAPTAGRATVNGRRYADLPAPLREVGVSLEARSTHPGRTALQHLRALAHTHGIPRRRVDEVIGMVGLQDVAEKRAGKLSLGMGQRLGIAAALLADPAALILDEPVNGLDPQGVLWIRTLLTSLAAEGRTVLLSSHLMSEMAQTAEHLVIIGRGRLLADTTVERFLGDAGLGAVRVVTPEAERLAGLLTVPPTGPTSGPPTCPPDSPPDDGAVRAGSAVQTVRAVPEAPDTLRVTGADAAHIGRTAAAHGIALRELTQHTASLEDAFMDLTRESVEHEGRAAAV